MAVITQSAGRSAASATAVGPGGDLDARAGQRGLQSGEQSGSAVTGDLGPQARAPCSASRATLPPAGQRDDAKAAGPPARQQIKRLLADRAGGAEDRNPTHQQPHQRER